MSVSLNVGIVPPSEQRRGWDEDAYDMCCVGAALRGVHHCTCWEPVFDFEQEPLHEGPSEIRSKCCHDCAYRNGSPERSGDDDDDTDQLMMVAHDSQRTFWCHQGVRRIIAFRHPDGRELPAGDGNYAPPTAPDRIFRADGRPGELCAGWAAHGDRAAAEAVGN
jgi:hypothetical protein